MSENKALDILGIKPIGEAIKTTVTKTFEGVEAFLKLTCAPALEELGLMAKDQVRVWRLNNVFQILEKAKGKLEYEKGNLELKAHPRVGLSIIENGSLVDNDELQEMWAGMFASSCSEDGRDDQNLIFVDLLKQLTSLEVRIIKYACEKSKKIIYKNGLVIADELQLTYDELTACTNVFDLHRLDRELDHLNSLDLIRGGFLIGGYSTVESSENTARTTPSALALNLYVRCQGYSKSVAEYWAIDLVPNEVLEKEQQDKIRQENEKQNQQFEEMRQQMQEKLKTK
jgi:hypothetical protein